MRSRNHEAAEDSDSCLAGRHPQITAMTFFNAHMHEGSGFICSSGALSASYSERFPEGLRLETDTDKVGCPKISLAAKPEDSNARYLQQEQT